MKHLFSLMLLFMAIACGAQGITYSSFEKFDLRSGDYSVVGKVGGRIFTYRASSDGYFLDAWNDSMERAATVILDFFPEKIYDTRFIAYPDKIIVLFQANERGRITQHAALLDATGRLQGQILQLAEVKTGIFGASGNYFSSAVSEDKKYISVYAASGKGANLTISHTLLDDELKIVQRSDASYAGENALETGPALLDNRGNLYLPVTTNTGSRDYADGIWLLMLPRGSGRLVHTELPLAGNYGSGLYFRMDNVARRVYAGGFYSPKKSGNYDGILFAYFNTDSGNAATVRRIPLEDRLREASGERSKRRAFNDYQTRQLIIRNDGGFVLVAEDYYMSVRTGVGVGPYGYYNSYYSPFMGSQNIREYHYGDILALSYNAEGVREWSSFIRKDQYSQEDGGVFSSYAFINTGGSLGFLYNNYDSRRSRITLAVVDAEGRIDTHALDAGAAQDPDWIPRAGRQVSARELVVPCMRRRQICFAKVVF
jgi:hypothetical protein